MVNGTPDGFSPYIIANSVFLCPSLSGSCVVMPGYNLGYKFLLNHKARLYKAHKRTLLSTVQTFLATVTPDLPSGRAHLLKLLLVGL